MSGRSSRGWGTSSRSSPRPRVRSTRSCSTGRMARCGEARAITARTTGSDGEARGGSMKRSHARQASVLRMFAAPLLVAATAPAVGECPNHLFVVARSKNANIVAYDAQTEPSGALSSKAVVAYWLLDGDPARREELNTIEWNRAYGFDIEKGSEPATRTLLFKAGKKRPLT